MVIFVNFALILKINGFYHAKNFNFRFICLFADLFGPVKEFEGTEDGGKDRDFLRRCR